MTLRRYTPLKRSGFLSRGKPLPRVNKERAKRRRDEAFGAQAELCRRMPCVVCWRPTAADVDPDVSGLIGAARRFGKSMALSDPHHVPTRGAGGRDGDTVPLCRAHHQEWHGIGERSFDAKYGLNLRAVARSIREAMRG